ncbi:hypothetical protein E5676_scaffold420G00470 [Cucumis melo var. makuwa]|uniref:Uncharacterized protein n=1 Tax=Cucumis melo var. makuwa TaxID=1194695 RepID=A0A5A7V224_CUCMM|nr:hypothetical protein E6C27_scaffold22G003970 [Cucumis melo var. makuwa]TYK00779.1 hypothetical protein E5676_scaffold420G00470 [Cucumis melo var. makuwa]
MHKNVGESENIVRKGYTDVFRSVGPPVRKSESGEAFLTREQHGIGNASPDVVFPDAVENTSLDVVFGNETTGVGKSSPDVVFFDSYRSVGNDFF